jgi:hypothetical protein
LTYKLGIVLSEPRVVEQASSCGPRSQLFDETQSEEIDQLVGDVGWDRRGIVFDDAEEHWL